VVQVRFYIDNPTMRAALAGEGTPAGG
jgi:hypothetical protein